MAGELEGMWQRVYRRVQQIASDEIVHVFGQAWRGGKMDAAYLSGRIPFRVLPQNHGTVLISIPASTDPTTHGDYGTQHVAFANAYAATTLSAGAGAGVTTVVVASIANLATLQTVRLTQATGSHLTELATITAITTATKVVTLAAGLTNAYIAGDVLIVVPDVVLGSGDMGWDATRANVDNAGFDLTLARRVSLVNSEYGTAADTIASGTDHKDVTITFPTAFQAAPVVTANVDNTLCRVTVLGTPTTTQAVLRVTYVPSTAAGTIASATTDIKPSAGAERTDGSGVGSTGAPSDNETDSTTTPTDSTGAASTVNHTHHIANPGTSTDTDAGGVNHTHGVGGHTHGMKTHTHGTPDHSHTLTDPGHTHGFTGSAQNAPSNTAFTLHWQASGTRVAPAVTKEASWIAIGG